jgi:hypothetical protein
LYSNTSAQKTGQLSLSLFEVRLETACTTSQVRERYLFKSLGGEETKRQTPEGVFIARRLPGKVGRESLWAIFFRPNSTQMAA